MAEGGGEGGESGPEASCQGGHQAPLRFGRAKRNVPEARFRCLKGESKEWL